FLAFARLGIAASILPICALLGAAAEQRALHPPLRQFLEDRIGGFAIDSRDVERKDIAVEIEGRLLADAFLTESGAAMRVHVDRVSAGSCFEPAAGGVSLTVQGVLSAGVVGEWRAGRTIRATAVLRRPARYLNDGVPDLERMMARRGVTLVGTVKSAALVRVLGRGGWLDEAASAIREVVRRAMARHVGSRDPQSAAIAVAILIGDRSALDPVVEQRLQEAGTYHVIAISGGNIAILAGLVLGVLWMVSIRGGWAAGFAIVTLVAYAFIAGGGSSVLRATVMAVVYLGLRIIDQRTAPLHVMSVTVVALLIASPLSIADVGLWLTFGATAAIVAGASLIRLPEASWWKAPAALIAASLAAEVVLIPIGAFVFQRVTIAGLAVNLAAIPSMAVVQVAAMVTAAADAIGVESLAGIGGWITHAGVLGLVESARLVDLAPWLTWRVPSPVLGVVAAYYACLVAAVLLKKWVRPAVAAGTLLLWIALAPQTFARTFGDGQLRLTMIDVGQGDAEVVTFPNGRTLLVDSGGVSLGGAFDIGDRVIGPALRARGISRLDYLAITHGDPDHIGGAAAIVRDFNPREIWYGTYVNNHAPSMQLQSMALRKRAAWRWLQRGERLDIGGVEVRVHHPAPEDWQRQKVRNDDSLVIELRYGQVSMLLTGDIGREVEEALLPTLDLLPTVVLKSPHHGSGTSSSDAFIEKLKPHIVVVGVGRANPYGHPVPRVLERYDRARSQVLRTDLDGQIDISTDGTRLFTKTFGSSPSASAPRVDRATDLAGVDRR
ncbi:MAG TPA: DNA internalization-related competence protein ComEC/Rec2, partial [Vicinamibacterales bacterium]|nr:DNA internalization-related competence protein ComEC/Rec2 [Vicinamibacterales bacterium]